MSLHHSPGIALDLAAGRAEEARRAALARQRADLCHVHHEMETDLPETLAPWTALRAAVHWCLAPLHHKPVPLR